MLKPENIAGQGFHTNPERINKTGLNRGSRWLSTLLRDELSKEGKALKLVEKLMQKAIDEGDLPAIKEILDRIEGKAIQTVNTDVTVNQGILNVDPLNDSGDNGPAKDSAIT
jgi:hypothetical protein